MIAIAIASSLFSQVFNPLIISMHTLHAFSEGRSNSCSTGSSCREGKGYELIIYCKLADYYRFWQITARCCCTVYIYIANSNSCKRKMISEAWFTIYMTLHSACVTRVKKHTRFHSLRTLMTLYVYRLQHHNYCEPCRLNCNSL